MTKFTQQRDGDEFTDIGNYNNMNREIKFRVRNTKTNEWIHKPGYEVNLFGEIILMGGFMDKVGIEELNDCAALQYTGVKDKNGKEIYEGDIIQYGIDFSKRIGWVSFLAGMFVCNWDDQTEKELAYMTTQDMIVVGNEFENPELYENNKNKAV